MRCKKCRARGRQVDDRVSILAMACCEYAHLVLRSALSQTLSQIRSQVDARLDVLKLLLEVSSRNVHSVLRELLHCLYVHPRYLRSHARPPSRPRSFGTPDGTAWTMCAALKEKLRTEESLLSLVRKPLKMTCDDRGM